MKTNSWRVYLAFAVFSCSLAVADTSQEKDAAEQEPTKTLRTFLESIRSGKIKKAADLTDPESAVPRQLDDFQKIGGVEKLHVAKVYASNDAALAVTTSVHERRIPDGVLVLTARIKNNKWLIDDIDLEDAEGLKKEIQQFLRRHPKAKLLWKRDSAG